MTFPDSERVVYGQNPLAEVVAQLRFPPILKIDSEPPAAFQDAIRMHYPEYSDAAPAPALPDNLPPQILNMIKGFAPSQSGGRQHQFSSEERDWQVTLTRQSLELRTTSYRRWEDFRSRLVNLTAELERNYQPSMYGRVGLRYVDVVRRSLLGLKDVPWLELLNPQVAGELSAPEFGKIDSASRQIHCELEGDNRYLTLKSGIALAEPDKEKCFLIDADFHTHKRTETQNVFNIVDAFNRMSGNFFRWCIKRRLHEALRPEKI
jgi:uncharacterized protein (TIGR04255 family)